jgi:DNA modification methylase
MPVKDADVINDVSPYDGSVGANKDMSPYWQSPTDNARIWQGDVRQVLPHIPTESVQCVVTSPPYWGLRDYGTGTWEGGDTKCDHRKRTKRNDDGRTTGQGGPIGSGIELFDGICGKCGAIRIDQQIGSEPIPDCMTWGKAQCGRCYVCVMVDVFRQVWRILRDDGILWLNLGDTYGADNNRNGMSDYGSTLGGRNRKPNNPMVNHGSTGLSPGNLVGIPWRVALALQADGWILRSDVVWCLSGGTWLYVRSKKGDMPMMVCDIARLDPLTVKLWNGERWTQLLGMSCSARDGTEREIVLRSGERISCSANHRFPTQRGLLESSSLRVGDVIQSCRLPEPDSPKRPDHIGNDAAWFAGLYLAEGCGVDIGTIQIAGHVREVSRWERVQRIARSYGGYATITVNGNVQSIRVYGKVICSVVRELISGNGAKKKGISPVVWRYSNEFVESLLLGYLEGDGHWEEKNQRWRLGFARDYNLERDLRAACARLGWTITLNPSFAECEGRRFPSFRGEIRKSRSGHWNEKDRGEVIEIRNARCREVYDLGVEDDPHLFSLASGILTHNSKPNPMPESCQNRCTKSHEYMFQFVKQEDYFCDMMAVKETSVTNPHNPGNKKRDAGENCQSFDNSSKWQDPKRVWGNGQSKKRDVWSVDDEQALLQWIAQNHPDQLVEFLEQRENKLDVWNVATHPYSGVHYATFPPKLIEPCILAGTGEKGCCTNCGKCWVRTVRRYGYTKTVGESDVKRRRTLLPNRNGIDSTLDSGIAKTETIGWKPQCSCSNCGKCGKPWSHACGCGVEFKHPETRPCVVFDPFLGSGTAAEVSLLHGRHCWGVELSEEYLKMNAIPRILSVLLRIDARR